VETLIRKTSLLRTVPTACGQAADNRPRSRVRPRASSLATFARGFVHDRSSELAHGRDFHHAPCSERSYLFTMSDIFQMSVQPRIHKVCIRAGPKSRVRIEPGGLMQARNCHFTDEQSSIEQSSQNPSWWSQTGSNRRPPACKAGALPTELWPLSYGSQ
jgi:hypothetical protein